MLCTFLENIKIRPFVKVANYKLIRLKLLSHIRLIGKVKKFSKSTFLRVKEMFKQL